VPSDHPQLLIQLFRFILSGVHIILEVEAVVDVDAQVLVGGGEGETLKRSCLHLLPFIYADLHDCGLLLV